jgi:hypothetical protein
MTSGPALAHRLLHPPGLFGAAAPRRLALPFFVGIAGLAATATVAAMGGVPAHDAIHLLIYSAVGATAAGLAAAAVLARRVGPASRFKPSSPPSPPSSPWPSA